MSCDAFDGKTLAVMLGGTAAERSISLESGENVARALERGGAKVLRVDPAEQGWPERLEEASFVFNLLHGPGGEDGTVQGLFELMKLPYSGCGLLASALTMDKVRTKWLWQGIDLPTPAFTVLSADSDWSKIIEELGTVFVKPALEGSSLGMSKATDASALQEAFDAAVAYGGPVIAEQFVAGAEYTVAILNGRTLPSIRIDVAGDFYDFDAKYHSEQTRFTCPSDLTVEEEQSLSSLALNAFSAVGGEVWGRVDIMRDTADAWQLLEVNTIPGMTSHSLVPLAAKVAGMSLLEMLVEIYDSSLEVRRAEA